MMETRGMVEMRPCKVIRILESVGGYGGDGGNAKGATVAMRQRQGWLC